MRPPTTSRQWWIVAGVYCPPGLVVTSGNVVYSVSAAPMASSAQSCPLCGGTGWKPAPTSEPGGVHRVERCECAADASLQRRLDAARIPPRYEHCTFDHFSTHNQSLSWARIGAERFARDYPASAEFGLLFMGPCGVGKTHLAVSIMRALLEKGVECLFYDFRELLKEIQASYNPVSQTTEMQVLAPVLETDVLLLDDLGASKPSVWVLDTVAHILNTRYNEKRVTVITTNYLDEARRKGAMREDTLADRIGERMRSRLYEMCQSVFMEAEDFRRIGKHAHYHVPGS